MLLARIVVTVMTNIRSGINLLQEPLLMCGMELNLTAVKNIVVFS